MNFLNNSFRIAVTIITVLFAIIFCWIAYNNYIANPWTRDGVVEAQVLQIAPRVSGPIITTTLKDNQAIKKDQLLFEIDPQPFKVAVNEAQASLYKAQAKEQELKLEAERRQKIPTAITVEQLTQATSKYKVAKAEVVVAQSNLEQAKLNLSYTKVYAPVSGYITNLNIDQGTYVTAGKPILALVDKNSYWVYGYFKETLLSRIQVGDQAIVTLMAYPDSKIKGRVISFSRGIARSDDQTATNLLPEVSATFDWIRLAQRVPIRIHLTQVPKNVQLILGTTASVVILPKTASSSKISISK